jgi:hypothetical protein
MSEIWINLLAFVGFMSVGVAAAYRSNWVMMVGCTLLVVFALSRLAAVMGGVW